MKSMVLSLFLFGTILVALAVFSFDKSIKKVWAKLWKFEIGIERETTKKKKH